jgi:hypothetical protein
VDGLTAICTRVEPPLMCRSGASGCIVDSPRVRQRRWGHQGGMSPPQLVSPRIRNVMSSGPQRTQSVISRPKTSGRNPDLAGVKTGFEASSVSPCCRTTSDRLAPVRSTSIGLAPDRSAPVRSTSSHSTPERSQPDRFRNGAGAAVQSTGGNVVEVVEVVDVEVVGGGSARLSADRYALMGRE